MREGEKDGPMPMHPTTGNRAEEKTQLQAKLGDLAGFNDVAVLHETVSRITECNRLGASGASTTTSNNPHCSAQLRPTASLTQKEQGICRMERQTLRV